MVSKGQELVLVLRDLTLDARKILVDPARRATMEQGVLEGYRGGGSAKAGAGGGARPQVVAAAGAISGGLGAMGRAQTCCRKGEPLPGPERVLLSNTQKWIVRGARAQEPQLLKPVCPRACALQQEKPPQ